MEEQETNFHLEPDVIINDVDPLEINIQARGCQKKRSNKVMEQIRLGPEISLIPVKKKLPLMKQISDQLMCGNQNGDLHHVMLPIRSPRNNIRLVTKEEAQKAENELASIKRKSLPLEKCPICKKFFRRMKTHLQKHVDIQRDPSDPLTCKFCMKAFNTFSNLSIHMRTHTGDKPYVCEVCTKGFAQSCNLVNHMRIHTGERPYKCPHCERAFTQSGNLNNHIRLHTDEKPFRCHFCEKAFTQSGNLNSHIRNNHKFTSILDLSNGFR